MSTDLDFIHYVRSQSGLGAELTEKKMFGEYALYLGGKVVALACDNQLYVKPTDAGRQFLGASVSEHAPFDGAKLYFRIDDDLENRERLVGLLRTTAQALPMPKPKAKARAKPETRTAKAAPARKATTKRR